MQYPFLFHPRSQNDIEYSEDGTMTLNTPVYDYVSQYCLVVMASSCLIISSDVTGNNNLAVESADCIARSLLHFCFDLYIIYGISVSNFIVKTRKCLCDIMAVKCANI